LAITAFFQAFPEKLTRYQSNYRKNTGAESAKINPQTKNHA